MQSADELRERQFSEERTGWLGPDATHTSGLRADASHEVVDRRERSDLQKRVNA